MRNVSTASLTFASYKILMRAFNGLSGTRFEVRQGFHIRVMQLTRFSFSNQINEWLSTFMSGGLSSFSYWFMGIPADNIKK